MVMYSFQTHFYTYNASFIGYAVPGHSGAMDIDLKELSASCLQVVAACREVPLRHYSNVYENLYTINSSEAGINYKFEGLAGFCHMKQVLNTVPLYQYSKRVTVENNVYTDHYYTTDADKIGLVTPGTTGKNEYTYEGVICFVYNVKYPAIKTLAELLSFSVHLFNFTL